MYCPNCATPAIKDQKYCRQCGQDLNMVAQVIKGQSAIEAWNRAAALWGMTLFIGGAAAGSVIKVLGKEGIRPVGEFTPYLQALILLLVFAGLGMLVYAFLPAMKVRHLSRPTDRPAKPADTQPDLLAEAPATVTEHTTEILEKESRLGGPVASRQP